MYNCQMMESSFKNQRLTPPTLQRRMVCECKKQFYETYQYGQVTIIDKQHSYSLKFMISFFFFFFGIVLKHDFIF